MDGNFIFLIVALFVVVVYVINRMRGNSRHRKK